MTFNKCVFLSNRVYNTYLKWTILAVDLPTWRYSNKFEIFKIKTFFMIRFHFWFDFFKMQWNEQSQLLENLLRSLSSLNLKYVYYSSPYIVILHHRNYFFACLIKLRMRFCSLHTYLPTDVILLMKVMLFWCFMSFDFDSIMVKELGQISH